MENIYPGRDIELDADRREELEELLASEVMYDDFDEDFDDEDFVGFDDDFPVMLEYENEYYDEFYNDY